MFIFYHSLPGFSEDIAVALASPICAGGSASTALSHPVGGQFMLVGDGHSLALLSLQPGRMRLTAILSEHPSIILLLAAIGLFSGGFAYLLRRRSYRHFLTINNRASIDELSGLLRRDEFLRQVAREAAQRQDAASVASLLAIDIDHFKSVNDRFGHAAGDEVIRSFGRLSTSALRSGDLIGRTGGEEFMVFLPALPKYLAAEVADRLRKRFAAQAFIFGDAPVFVTISVGVATAQPGEPPLSAVVRANQRLYQAKRNGRNCVVTHDEGQAPNG